MRVLRALWCNLTHSHSVTVEWSTKMISDTGSVSTIVRVSCGVCDRELRKGARARCTACGSRINHHQGPDIRWAPPPPPPTPSFRDGTIPLGGEAL